MKLRVLCLIACLCGLTLVDSAPAVQDGDGVQSPQPSPRQPGVRQRSGLPEQKLFSVEFPGGTVADYIEAVRKAAGDVNVVILGNVRDIPMQPVRLAGVDAQSALQVLNETPRVQKGRGVEVRVSHEPPNSADELPLFTVHSSLDVQESPRVQKSMVFSVAEILNQDVKAEDLLTAVQTALELLGDDYEPAQIKFHEATGLIIARGHPNQMQDVYEVLDRLTGQARDKLAAKQVREQRAAEVRQGLDQELRHITMELTTCKTRNDVLEEEMARLRAAFDDREALIDRLRGELAELKRSNPQ